MPKRIFAVLESRWSQNEVSLRPLYDLLCDSQKDYGRGVYIYERFWSEISLADVLKFVAQKEGSPYLYIGSHGESGQLKLPNKDKDCISAHRLGRLISKAYLGTSGKVSGLFISGCGFMKEANARTIFNHMKSLEWTCGYDRDADWFESALFEALFCKILWCIQ